MGDMAEDYNYQQHHSFAVNGIDKPKRKRKAKPTNNLTQE